MSYDIQIILPVSNREPYKTRLKNFKKWGLSNIGSKQVLVSLICGDETIEEGGWHNNIDVELISCHTNSLAAKLYHYLSNYTPDQAKKARWIAKIDDDSINDISGLVDNLDNEYDHERDYYIVTELKNDCQQEETKILMKHGYEKWVKFKNGNIFHEYEGSIVSSAAMEKITSHPESVNFLSKRAEIHSGVTDVALAYAALMCKIPPSSAFFLSAHPELAHLSLLGGHLNHIHFISHDRTPKVYQMFQELIDNKKMTPQDLEIFNKAKNKKYVFGNNVNPNKPYGLIELKENGRIQNSTSPNEVLWRVKNSKIEFLSARCKQTTIFEYKEVGAMEAPFLENIEVKHFLHKLS